MIVKKVFQKKKVLFEKVFFQSLSARGAGTERKPKASVPALRACKLWKKTFSEQNFFLLENFFDNHLFLENKLLWAKRFCGSLQRLSRKDWESAAFKRFGAFWFPVNFIFDIGFLQSIPLKVAQKENFEIFLFGTFRNPSKLSKIFLSSQIHVVAHHFFWKKFS